MGGGSYWIVKHGELKRGKGHPGSVEPLFEVIGEKLPYACLIDVEGHLKEVGLRSNGVYMAHDSMGGARYVGRGSIFSRLRTHFKTDERELAYFSFYVVREKRYEREVETLLIRAAGPQLHFNERKKRVDIDPGSVTAYEAGTYFYERQKKKGPNPNV